MAFAINIKTESSDEYLIVLEGEPFIKDIVDKVKEELDDEIHYISSINTKATYECSEYLINKLKNILFSLDEEEI